MSFLGSMVGLNGTGLNFQAQSAPLIQAANAQQANQLYGQAQSGINQQQQFVNALQSQGTQGISSQSALSGMLMNQAQGGGPNPAQAQLAQATGANTANQAALMAGQRGAGSNVGLIARQAAQQGAANQQNAAGQAATMQAQQSLAAQQQLQNLAGTQVSQQGEALSNLNTQTQGEQGQILGAIGQLNNASVANTAQQNAANAGIQQIAAQGQQQLAGGVTQGLGNGLMAAGATGGQITPNHGFINGRGYADGGPVIPQDASTQSAAAPQKSFVQKVIAPQQSSNNTDQSQPFTQKANVPAMQGAGTAIGAGAASGLKSLFTPSDNATPMQTTPTASQADSTMPDVTTPQAPAKGANSSSISPSEVANLSKLAMFAAKGGKVPAMLSPGEVYLEPEQAKKVAKGKADPIKTGRHIPGKAKVKGDSLKNDIVPTTLDAGGVVIPRSVLSSKTPHKDAYKFVNAVISKHRMSK